MNLARILPASLAASPAPFLAGFVATALAAAVLTPVVAQDAQSDADPKPLGAFDDWQAVTFDEGGNTGCYITSKPTKEEGDYSQRGRVYVLVTHRPKDGSFDVVSVVAGYTYKEGSGVTLTIDQTDFPLFTHADSAWAPDTETDRQLVAAMKGGNSMVVRGTSTRGTETTDTYSLTGFTRAYNAIAEACPR